MMDRDSFGRIIVTLAEAYPSTRLTEAQVRLYYRALEDLSAEQVGAACLRTVQELKYFPTIAELRTFVAASVDDAALLAWGGLTRAAREVGSYESLDVEDPAAAAALLHAFGSWAAFCETDDGPALTQKRQEFLAAYRQARRIHSPTRSRLPGRCESSGRYASAVYSAGLLTASWEVVPQYRGARTIGPTPTVNRLGTGDDRS